MLRPLNHEVSPSEWYVPPADAEWILTRLGADCGVEGRVSRCSASLSGLDPPVTGSHENDGPSPGALYLPVILQIQIL